MSKFKKEDVERITKGLEAIEKALTTVVKDGGPSKSDFERQNPDWKTYLEWARSKEEDKEKKKGGEGSGRYKVWGYAESGYHKDLGEIEGKDHETALANARKKFGHANVRSVEPI